MVSAVPGYHTLGNAREIQGRGHSKPAASIRNQDKMDFSPGDATGLNCASWEEQNQGKEIGPVEILNSEFLLSAHFPVVCSPLQNMGSKG